MTKTVTRGAKKRAKLVVGRRGSRSLRLSDGQIKLLMKHGYKGLSEEKLRTLKRAHDRFLASARFSPSSDNNAEALTLSEAERRVERYLEAL